MLVVHFRALTPFTTGLFGQEVCILLHLNAFIGGWSGEAYLTLTLVKLI